MERPCTTTQDAEPQNMPFVRNIVDATNPAVVVCHPSTQRQLTDILSHRLDRKEPHRCRPAYRSAIRGRPPPSSTDILEKSSSLPAWVRSTPGAVCVGRRQHEPWDKQKAPITPFVQPLRLPDSVSRGPVVRSTPEATRSHR